MTPRLSRLAPRLIPPQEYLDGLSLEQLIREDDDARRELDWVEKTFNVGTKAREFYEDAWERLEHLVYEKVCAELSRDGESRGQTWSRFIKEHEYEPSP